MKKLLNHAVLHVTAAAFIWASTGTLAHARNAYQRSQSQVRLNQQKTLGHSKLAAHFKQALDRWEVEGERIKNRYDYQLDQIAYDFARYQLKTLDSLSRQEEHQLQKEFERIGKAAVQNGDVAMAEQFESMNRYSSDFRTSIRKVISERTAQSFKEQVILGVETAGSVKGWIEDIAQKLTTQKMSGLRGFFHFFLPGILVIGTGAAIGGLIAEIIAGASASALTLASLGVAVLLGVTIWYLDMVIRAENENNRPRRPPSFE